MANQLFRTKPLSLLLAEEAGTHRLRRILGPVQLTALGVGAIIATGIFILTGADAVVRDGGTRVRVCGTVLRRVRVNGAGGRLGLHVRLCDPGRIVRLDHRLGLDSRVCRWLSDGGTRMGRALS